MQGMPERLSTMLEHEHVPYRTLSHPRDFTAQETAAHTHVKGSRFAKVVILVADDRYLMAVIPSHHRLQWGRMKTVLGAREIHLATEAEMRMIFPDCEVGAEPPFGSLYQLPVYMSNAIERTGEIAFNAGTHEQVVAIKVEDFVRLVQPRFCDISWSELESPLH